MSRLPYGCSMKTFGMLNIVNLSQLKLCKIAEGRWWRGMEEQLLPWHCHVGRREISFLSLGKASVEKVWTLSFKRLKINFLTFHCKTAFERNLYLMIQKNTQSTSAGNPSSIAKCFTLSLEKKVTTHLLIDVPERYRLIILLGEKRKSREYFLSSAQLKKFFQPFPFNLVTSSLSAWF